MKNVPNLLEQLRNKIHQESRWTKQYYWVTQKEVKTFRLSLSLALAIEIEQLKTLMAGQNLLLTAIYEPLEVAKCEKCGKVIAEPKELIRIGARVSTWFFG